MTEPIPFELADDRKSATNGTNVLTIVGDGKCFLRRAMKPFAEGNRRVEWAVGELDGVRCYFDGTNVILSKEDLMP